MRRNILVTILAFAALGNAAAAQAQASLADQLGPLIGAANADQTKAPTLKKEADDLVAANETRNKEYVLYPPQLKRIDDNIKARFAPIQAVANQYKPDLDAYQAQNNQYAGDAASYTSACTGRQLPQPEYHSCLGWKSRLDQQRAYLLTVKAGLDNRKARIDAQVAAFRVEEAQMLVQRQAISRRMDEIAAEMRRNFAAWEAKSAELRAFQARIDRIHGLCGVADRRCAQRDPDGCEALKHCHAISWDGARSNLPPLGPLQRAPFATPNQ